LSLAPLQPGGTWRKRFTVKNSSGVPAAPDSLPTALFYKNGTADGTVTVTVTQAQDAGSSNITGVYVMSATVPVGYAANDVVSALVTVVLSSTTYKDWTDEERLVQWPATVLPNAAAEAAGGLVTNGTGTGQISLSGGRAASNVTYWGGNAIVAPNVSGTPVVDIGKILGANFQTSSDDAANRYFCVVGGDTVTGAAYALASGNDMSTLLTRLSSARAGYLDKLNISGNVASQADVLAINQSASKHLILATVGQYERPESSTVTYTVECRTYAAATGAAVNADTTPTLTATGTVTGSLAANLSSATNPATGVYRWTYTVNSTDAIEQIRFDVSASISTTTFTLSAYTQVADFVAATFTTADRALLAATATEANATTNKNTVLAAIPSASTIATQVDTTLSGTHGSGAWTGGGTVVGTGADRCTQTFVNSDTGLPVADADLWITSDAAGDNVVAGTLQSNSSGQATFLLDAGTVYYFWAQKDGVNPILGERFTAEAD
jgi:hypothetical protein